MKKNYITGTTTLGFKWKIDVEMLKDFNFLRALRKIHSEDGMEALDGMEDAITVIFNDHEKEEEFYKFLAEKNGGRVPVGVLSAEVKDIITKLKEADKEIKNS